MAGTLTDSDASVPPPDGKSLRRENRGGGLIRLDGPRTWSASDRCPYVVVVTRSSLGAATAAARARRRYESPPILIGGGLVPSNTRRYTDGVFGFGIIHAGIPAVSSSRISDPPTVPPPLPSADA